MDSLEKKIHVFVCDDTWGGFQQWLTSIDSAFADMRVSAVELVFEPSTRERTIDKVVAWFHDDDPRIRLPPKGDERSYWKRVFRYVSTGCRYYPTSDIDRDQIVSQWEKQIVEHLRAGEMVFEPSDLFAIVLIGDCMKFSEIRTFGDLLQSWPAPASSSSVTSEQSQPVPKANSPHDSSTCMIV